VSGESRLALRAEARHHRHPDHRPRTNGHPGGETMDFLNDLPTDSVLRRHALTERNRVLLGLPPTDSVLQRHHAQWLAAQAASPGAAAAPPAAPVRAAAAPAAAPARPSAPAPAARPMPPTAAPAARAAAPAPVHAPPASGGGLMGWLRRLFG
jgi:hypothetical protein